MRELHGVMSLYSTLENQGSLLKQRAFLFDKIYLHQLDRLLDDLSRLKEPLAIAADLKFLRSRGFLEDVDETVVGVGLQRTIEILIEHPTSGYTIGGGEDSGQLVRNLAIREMSIELNSDRSETVAILETQPGSSPFDLPVGKEHPPTTNLDVLRIGMEIFPTPSADCAWDDILSFKAEMYNKQWCFRRFLQTLSSKQQTEAEIRDEIDWLVSEYEKAMHIHAIKAGHSHFEIYVIPAVEVIENLVKLNWSQIAKGVLSVKKRKVELMEAEMKAPGRECAYVFDARKRFGHP